MYFKLLVVAAYSGHGCFICSVLFIAGQKRKCVSVVKSDCPCSLASYIVCFSLCGIAWNFIKSFILLNAG
jgi:hypothetical protein